jgi:hypothetical protein
VWQIRSTLRSSKSVYVDPGASWSVVPLAVTLAIPRFANEAMNRDVDIEAVVIQSSTAAAAQFSTERGTFPSSLKNLPRLGS